MKAQKIITNQPYSVIIVLFLFSVLVRLPNLNRPLSKHHEFCTALSLRIMQIWTDTGVTTYNFNPVMSYPGESNKFINNQAPSYFDKNGDTYYESYPPGSYLLPFFIFSIFHIYPDVLPIQLYNLLLQLIECIFLYKIVMLFAGKEKREKFKVVGLLAVIFNLFNPAALWFHSNVYINDMQGTTFFVISVFLLLKICLKNEFTSPRWLLLLGLVNFILTYSDYTGVTFSVIAGLYYLIKAFKKKQFIFPLVVITLSCFAALSLAVYQYSLINGLHALAGISKYRYSYRSGYEHGENFFFLIGGVIRNYITCFLPELFLIVTGVIVLAVKKSLMDFLRKGMMVLPLIILVVFPVILHHLIFLNASQNEYFMLRASPFVSLLCAALFYFIFKGNFFSFLEEYRQPVFALILGVITASNIVMYYAINKPGRFSISGEPYEKEKLQGVYIKQNALRDEVVFIKGFDDEPQTILYAHRNLRTIITDSDAETFLRTYHRSKGVIFTLDSRGFVTTEKHISI